MFVEDALTSPVCEMLLYDTKHRFSLVVYKT